MMKLERIDKDVWVFPDDAVPNELADDFETALKAWHEGKVAVTEKTL